MPPTTPFGSPSSPPTSAPCSSAATAAATAAFFSPFPLPSPLPEVTLPPPQRLPPTSSPHRRRLYSAHPRFPPSSPSGTTRTISSSFPSASPIVRTPHEGSPASPESSPAGCHTRIPCDSPLTSTVPSASPPSGDVPAVPAVTSPPRTLGRRARMSSPASRSVSALVPAEGAAASPLAADAQEHEMEDAVLVVEEAASAEADASEQQQQPLQASSKLLMGLLQSPHYTPLQHRPKRIRHNLISGYDRAFTETAETIQSITWEEFRSGEDDLRMTLEELEAMGYRVAPLRHRLDALSAAVREREAVKQEMEEAVGRVKERREGLQLLRAEIAELRTKEVEKEEGIRELVRWVEELKGKLRGLDDVFGDIAGAPLL